MAESFYVNGTYDVGVQTCLSLPLWIQSAPDEAITASLSRALLHDLMDTQDFHFTTGIIGLKYTLEVRPRHSSMTQRNGRLCPATKQGSPDTSITTAAGLKLSSVFDWPGRRCCRCWGVRTWA